MGGQNKTTPHNQRSQRVPYVKLACYRFAHPTQRSPRFSPPDSPSHLSQSDPTSQDAVVTSVVYPSQAESPPSATTRHSVVTEPPRQVRELGSLSPVSENVLHNLLSPTETVTAAPLDQIPALASVFPANQPPRDQPATPEHHSSPEQHDGPVAIHSVQRPPPERSPWRSHIANSVSPNKFGVYGTLHDPNRTPARRIPIRDAIAQGSASPRKDYVSGPSTAVFRRPVFTRCTPEDRARSPVRRPPSDVVNHTAVVSSGITRPTTSPSPDKVRSGSEEPQPFRRPQLGRPFQRSASDSEIASPSKTRMPAFPIRPGVEARLPSTIPEERGIDSPMKTQSSPSPRSALRQPSSMVTSRIPRIGAKPYARPPEKEKQQDKGKDPVHKLLMTKRPMSTGLAPVSWRENRKQCVDSMARKTKPVRLVKSLNTTGSGSSSDDPMP